MLLFLLLSFSCSDLSPINKLFTLPTGLDEASAVEVTVQSNTIWTLEDQNNEPKLYGMDVSGKLVQTILVTGIKNNDWEDLSSDAGGNLYIGDFGNNDNDRKDLSIYKVNAPDLQSSQAGVSQKTTFYYRSQKDFPPKKTEKLYDSEAFFVWGNFFYIVSKNRSSNFDGTALLYRVPNQPGNFAAELIGSFQTCDNYKRCAVTSADISEDGKKVVILASDKVWIFQGFSGDRFFSGQPQEIDLGHFSQKEGVCFKDNNTLYITDEKDKKSGGNLYRIDIGNLKSKP